FPSWPKKWRKIAMKRYKQSSRNKTHSIQIRANEIYNRMLENPISVRPSTSKKQ
ncbi:unnamed protein product, partial [marine sediment metagenome]